MIDVREGSLTEHIDACEALLQENWAETGFDFPLRFDKELYKKFEAMGFLVIVGAFDGDTVVGYSIASVLPHPYNPEIVCGNSDAMFLRKEYRHGTAGARLKRETERLAKERGACRMFWHARGDTAFAESLRKRGCHLADEVFIERL